MIGCTLLLLFYVGLIGCSASNEQSVTKSNENSSPIESEGIVDSEHEEEYRIISTTVALTEILDALELNLVGIPTSYKELPERYKGVTEIGNTKTPDMEMVRWLQPTDILAVSTLEYELKPLFEEVGIAATFINLETLDGMLNSIRELGTKFNRTEQADRIINKMNKKVSDIQREVEGKEAPTVLILLGIPGSYLVATEHSYIGDLVRICGGVNVIQGENVEYLSSNTEYLQQANPDIILRAAHGMPKEVIEMFDREFKVNDIWKHFDAVNNGRVYDLDELFFPTTGNLATTEALDQLMEMLYGDVKHE
nr:heme ABC transporter substrate-binding protein IsdE [Caldalkalibacillus mannanilyticus]